jgi:hypothetical protein
VEENVQIPATERAGSALTRKIDGTLDPTIRKVLQNIHTWDFNVFELCSATNSSPLFYLVMELFQIYKFEECLGISEKTMVKFIKQVEASYRTTNTYHNSTHAADVTHAMHFFISVLGLGRVLPIEDVFACIIAASIHDVDHPGYNNFFMIATMSPVALRYNDVSVLEHYHCAKGFEIMNSPECNIMAHLTPEQSKTIRTSIISMVLATDMINHFEYISKFKNKINGEGLDLKYHKTLMLLMDVAIKCSDISNATKAPNLSLKWTSLIMDEFFLQVYVIDVGR